MIDEQLFVTNKLGRLGYTMSCIHDMYMQYIMPVLSLQPPILKHTLQIFAMVFVGYSFYRVDWPQAYSTLQVCIGPVHHVCIIATLVFMFLTVFS